MMVNICNICLPFTILNKENFSRYINSEKNICLLLNWLQVWWNLCKAGSSCYLNKTTFF